MKLNQLHDLTEREQAIIATAIQQKGVESPQFYLGINTDILGDNLFARKDEYTIEDLPLEGKPLLGDTKGFPLKWVDLAEFEIRFRSWDSKQDPIPTEMHSVYLREGKDFSEEYEEYKELRDLIQAASLLNPKLKEMQEELLPHLDPKLGRGDVPDVYVIKTPAGCFPMFHSYARENKYFLKYGGSTDWGNNCFVFGEDEEKAIKYFQQNILIEDGISQI